MTHLKRAFILLALYQTPQAWSHALNEHSSVPEFAQNFAMTAHSEASEAHPHHDCDMSDDDIESLLMGDDYLEIFSCTQASASQINTVNQGNAKRSQFLEACEQATGSTRWCLEVERPNPASRNTFTCTYGPNQPHRLIHPTESTWAHAFKAIELIQRLSSEGICVQQIYNWWRPEPYNHNVGGAAGRHPFGTAVDVRFCSNQDAIRAFDRLCQFRRQGQVRALGYYGSTGLHLGIADHTGNTWGRSCP